LGWSAALELEFSARDGLTRLARRAHHGPLAVQRPFLPEGPEVCHVYLLHPPGGLVGGDDLRIDVGVDAGARVLATTPAAGKAYRTNGQRARQRQHLRVAAGGALEWLPHETIVYDRADVALETTVELDAGATFIGAETLCFGLPARGEPFTQGLCAQSLELRRAGRPLLVERARFDGGAAHTAAWGLGGRDVLSLLVAAPAPLPDVVDALRALAASGDAAGDIAAVTVLGDGEALVIRQLARSAERARAFVRAAWRLVRPALLGRPPVAPRIWAT
jgi:urease accessory protein